MTEKELLKAEMRSLIQEQGEAIREMKRLKKEMQAIIAESSEKKRQR